MGVRWPDTTLSSHFRYMLRALLRQASYLPDAQARQHYRCFILTHFRKYALHDHPFRWVRAGVNEHKFPLRWRKKIASQQKVFVDDKISPGRRDVPARVRACNQLLHRLERANQGYRSNLLDVLLMTYGRKGARRHSLLQPLLSMDVPTSGKTRNIVAEQLARLPSMDPAFAASLPTIPPAVRHLLLSQREAHPPADKTHREKPRSFKEPAFAETNIWHRPTPASVAKNKAIHHYTSGLDSALPPIPAAEWESLRQLAHGETTWPGPVRKRIPAVPISSGDTSPCLGSEDNNLTVTRPLRTAAKEQPHSLTPRFMQRLYELVFRQCCKMDLNPEDGAPIFHWGQRQSKIPKHSISTEPSLAATKENQSR